MSTLSNLLLVHVLISGWQIFVKKQHLLFKTTFIWQNIYLFIEILNLNLQNIECEMIYCKILMTSWHQNINMYVASDSIAIPWGKSFFKFIFYAYRIPGVPGMYFVSVSISVNILWCVCACLCVWDFLTLICLLKVNNA